MSEVKTLNVASDLKGMAVLASDSGEKLGEVTDAIIHPVEGRVLGITLRTPAGERRVIPSRDFSIGVNAVMTATGSAARTTDTTGEWAGGVEAVGEIIGTNLVTEDGKLLGQVREVHILADRPQAIYRVAETTLQRFFGGGFYLAGDVPRSYSPDGARMIVPADTEARYAASSLAEAIQPSAVNKGAARPH
jgi:uncharacterized protein YrrD